MARIKSVYPTSMVCHLWANRHPHAIRNPHGNLSAASGRLYSYGHHYVIGAFLEQPAKGAEPVILWNENSYSSTTNGQKSDAWRALSTDQRARIVRVPSLSDSDIRDLSALALSCIKAAREPLEKSEKARQNRAHYLASANRWFDSARQLYAYTGDKKAAASVPIIASDADKQTAAKVLANIGRAEYLKAAADYLTRADSELTHAARLNESYTAWLAADMPDQAYAPSARQTSRAAHDARALFERAAHEFKKAGVNVPPKVAHGRVKAARIEADMSAGCIAENDTETRASIAAGMRELSQNLAYVNRENRTGKTPGIVLKSGRRILRGRSNFAYQMGDYHRLHGIGMRELDQTTAARLWPVEKERAAIIAELSRLQSRARRVLAAYTLETVCKDVAETCTEYETRAADSSYTGGYGLPTPSGIISALAKWPECPAHLRNMAEPIAARARAIQAAHGERIARINAAKIEAWRAGERVTVPHDVETMVRIVGDEVQTSRGAVVPLEHAARLIKLARRIASHGGQKWANGDGPIVGHFRVNAIEADLSAIIGCHTFSAEESARAAALIEAAIVTA